MRLAKWMFSFVLAALLCAGCFSIRQEVSGLRAAIDEMGLGRSDTLPYCQGTYGFDSEVWFSKSGWTPHYAEHVIDPADGLEKLVMADPHTQHKAFIWNIAEQRIEWEYDFGGVNNPHTARMLMEDIPCFGEKGDIYCVSPQEHVIVIDRRSREIKTTKQVPWTPNGLYDVIVGKNPGTVILSEYLGGPTSSGRVAKCSFDCGDMMTLDWAIDQVINQPGKLSQIEYTGTAHNPDFGGDYLVVDNTFEGQVYEISDSDGAIVWRSMFNYEGAALTKPHSAYRSGRVEAAGNVTIAAMESGGGIMAIASTGQPVWAIGAGGWHREPDLFYQMSRHGLTEVTHVFPTLDGRIGFVDWSGVDRSSVCIMNGLPQKQNANWQVYHERQVPAAYSSEAQVPIKADWDEIWITIKNTGEQPLTWRIRGCPALWGSITDPDRWFEEKAEEGLAPGAHAQYRIGRPWEWLLIDVRSSTAALTTVDCWVSAIRN